MANALSDGMGAPPAPNPTPDASSPAPNAMAGPVNSSAPANGGQPQQQIPPPNHQQTVAALRHFSAIEKELTIVLSDPSVGKSDLKSKIQDGAVTLVSNGILTPSAAVSMLTTLPDEPVKQKQWLQQHLQTTIQAADAVLGHHQAGFAGQPVDQTPYDPAQHTDIMSGLAKQYSGAANG